jgi:hypothetical protein
MIILLKAICRFKEILTKILMTFITEIEKVPKIHMQPQRTQNRQSNPKQQQKQNC